MLIAFCSGLPTSGIVLAYDVAIMVDIIEFALFAWIAVSVVAVLVQLIRIARYKSANRSVAPAQSSDAKPESATIDLGDRLKGTEPPTTPAADTSHAMAGAAPAEQQAPSAEQAPTTPAAPQPATPAPVPQQGSTPAAPTPPTPVAATPAPAAPPAAEPEPVAAPLDPPTPDQPAAAPTLADLLAGVRLPWNLLPAVDQSREPSNDRVALITGEGEPSEIGADIADELERLGFTIAPRGDDTAVATKEGRSLGLRIIEEPMTAEVDGVRRFPTATETSVALDIWVEANASA